MIHRCWAEVDLAALERNLKRIRAALPEYIRYIAVVKANAYGHGMAPVAARLMRSNADLFAVANLQEAAEINEIGSGWPILLLSPLLPDEDKLLAEIPAMPAISCQAEVKRFGQIGQSAGRSLTVHLKIDTGMGRMGVWYEDAAELYRAIQAHPFLQLGGICTHFSCADTDPEFTRWQRCIFLETLTRLEKQKTLTPILIHADNSASLESFSPQGPFNAVRIGLLQFGVLPVCGSLLAEVHVEPVFYFFTRIGLIKTLPAGIGISYGRTYITKRPTRIAVLTAGYGDGIPTTLNGKGKVLIHGRVCPFLGRVTMDQTIVDVTDLPEAAVGDTATLIGRQGKQEINVMDFSVWAQHIPWEVLCSITQRVPRIYRTGTEG